MNAPINPLKLWPVSSTGSASHAGTLRATVKAGRGYRIIRRAATVPSSTRPPIVIHLPAALHRLWAFLWQPWNEAHLQQLKAQARTACRWGGGLL